MMVMSIRDKTDRQIEHYDYEDKVENEIGIKNKKSGKSRWNEAKN